MSKDSEELVVHVGYDIHGEPTPFSCVLPPTCPFQWKAQVELLNVAGVGPPHMCPVLVVYDTSSGVDVEIDPVEDESLDEFDFNLQLLGWGTDGELYGVYTVEYWTHPCVVWDVVKTEPFRCHTSQSEIKGPACYTLLKTIKAASM